MDPARLASLTVRGVLLTAILLSLVANAEVRLRYFPEYQAIAPGDTGQLAILLDEALDFRTIELWTSFDPDVLTSQDGVPGDRFTATGCDLFPDFVLTSSSEWYGGVAILGSDCWGTGPGELFRWTFTGAASGSSLVESIDVRLYAPDAVLIENVTLGSALVRVDEAVSVEEAQSNALALRVHPNPCNPTLRIELSGPPGPALLELFDVDGRRLHRLWSGILDTRTSQLSWRGIDDAGRELPTGLYLLRLHCATGESRTCRVLLLR